MQKILSFLDDPRHPICSQNNIYARIITLCAVDIIHKTFSVIFEHHFFGFCHVGRLEHHAIAPMARLPK
jgi:hypothetical protein